jgi:hypothetical protein
MEIVLAFCCAVDFGRSAPAEKTNKLAITVIVKFFITVYDSLNFERMLSQGMALNIEP